MASIERSPRDPAQPAVSYAVKWRLGGKRGGAPQTLAFKVPPAPGPAAAAKMATATLKLAEAAKQLAESRRHAITQAEVRAAVLGDHPTIPAGVPTFAEWAVEYIADRRRAGDAQPDVLLTYERELTNLAVPRLGHLYLPEITRERGADWLAWMKAQRKRDGKPRSPKSVRNTHAIVHGCLAAAVPRWLPANPIARPVGASRRNPALPKVVPHQGIFLEPWELDTILDGCDDGLFHDMVEVEARTGLRMGELLVLRPSELVLGGKRQHVKVIRSLKNDGSVGPPKSATSVRDVTVSTRAATVLDRLAVGKRRNELLFTAPRGGRWSESNLRSRRWLPAVAAAQRCAVHPPPLPDAPKQGPRRLWRPDEVSTCGCAGVLRRSPRFHDLRHTHVSLLIAGGWMPKEIQVRMGHASIVITMDIYGHLWETPDTGRLDEVDMLLAGDSDQGDVDELGALAADTGPLASEVRDAMNAWRASRNRSSGRVLRLVADDEAC